MKFYRKLNAGELIQNGDQVVCNGEVCYIFKGRTGNDPIFVMDSEDIRREVPLPLLPPGYRWVELGEKLQFEDEYTQFSDGKWLNWYSTNEWGDIYDKNRQENRLLVYRRKVEEKKQPEMPDPGPGYRLLNNTEDIKLTDEVGYVDGHNRVCWVPVKNGGLYPSNSGYIYRRKVEEKKQPDPGAGYRLLEEGEILQCGDELWSESRESWQMTYYPGEPVGTTVTNFVYRRKSEYTKSLNSEIDRLKAEIGKLVQENAKLQSEKTELFLAYNNHIRHTDPHRRTGRTTRMLEKVAEALADGDTVEIVVATRNQIGRMQDDLEVIMGENGYDLCNYMDRLNFTSVQDKNCDEGFGLGNPSRGLPRYAKVFVDHYAAESYLATVKTRIDPFIHAYDK